MSQTELEKAALRPFFLPRLASNTASIIIPTSTFKIDFERVAFPDTDSDLINDIDRNGFPSTYLLPGGQFLVTNYGNCLIGLWDLEQLTPSTEKHGPIATLQPKTRQEEEFDDWFIFLVAVSVRGDGKASRLVIKAYLEDGEDYPSKLLIYEISPLQSSPTFTLLNSKPVFSHKITFDGDGLPLCSWM